MTAIHFLSLSIVLFILGAFASLLFLRSPGTSRWVAASFSLLASLSGVIAVILTAVGRSTPQSTLFTLPPFGELALRMDALSALLVAIISLVGVGTSLYSFREAPENVSVSFFTDLFMATMVLVVTVTNAFFFLIFWEVMTLASYFLVVWEFDQEQSARTGFIYFLVAHAGAALITIAFLLFFGEAGTLDFARIRTADLSPAVKDIAFVLVFLGFGAKAGMVPLHFWTPDTYAIAPTHVSALMSSVMKKTAVYGILRVCVDLLGVPDGWWGFTVLAFGTLSVVFGAFYALTERDLKKLLAFSSVENVGIILMGVGLGMLGISLRFPLLAELGFLAALYHMLNHAFFKGLLFLSSGVAVQQTGGRDLNQMGGLSRRMPWTSLFFLVAALGIVALPPLNGFVSEWFTYQALLNAAGTGQFVLRVFAPLFAILLAMAGALAVMVYIKGYGGAFTGPAHSQEAASAHETTVPARIGMGYMALGILVLGIGSPWIAPRIAWVAASVANQPLITVSMGWLIYPGNPLTSIVSTPLVAILLIGLLTMPLIVVALYGGWQTGRRSDVEPWVCGYGYDPRMSVRASSFDQPVKVTFRPLYWIRSTVERPYRAMDHFYHRSVAAFQRAEPSVENAVTRPTVRFVESAGHWIQNLQMGDIRLYCLYIIITLAILLIVLFGGSGL